MRCWAITGSARGLGHALAEEIARHGEAVVGLARSGGDIALDLRDPASIARAAEVIVEGPPIDVLVHNAAIRGDTNGLAGLDPADLLDVMQVNVAGPLLLTRALMPALSPGATIAFISSRAGSLAEGADPDGDYGYCLSKAALNRAMVKLVDDYPALRFLAIHPGWMRTEMGGPEAPVTPEDAAAALHALLSRSPGPPSGWFGDAWGRPIGW